MDHHHGDGTSDRGLSNVFQSASSLLNSSAFSHQQSPPSGHASTHGGPGKKPSYSTVMSSTQVLMQAAKSKLHKGEGSDSEQVDTGKIAAAAGHVLEAAAHYGKLEEGKYGKYVDKASKYLQQYEVKHGGHTATPQQGTTPPSSHGLSSFGTPPRGQSSQNYPPNYSQGPPNYSQGPPKYHQEPPNYNQGAANYNQGPPYYDQGAANYNQGPPNYHQGPANYNQGSPNYAPPHGHHAPPSGYPQAETASYPSYSNPAPTPGYPSHGSKDFF